MKSGARLTSCSQDSETMTADIVNLNKVRKARQRNVARKQAQENIVRFGQTKEEREKISSVERAKSRALDGAELPQQRRPSGPDTEPDDAT